MKKLTSKQYLIIASLIFGMFFGAENLIFPVHLGQMAGKNWLFAAIGLIISGTLIPLAALLALAVTRADGIFGLARPLRKKFALTFLDPGPPDLRAALRDSADGNRAFLHVL